MSHHVGGAFVRGSTVAKVRAAIATYWQGKGAKVSSRGALAYKIAAPVRGWIALYDSRRYTFDHGLAKHLAEALGCEVRWYTMYGATGGGIARTFGARKKLAVDGYGEVEEAIGALPGALVDLDEVADPAATIAFTGAKAYDAGPKPDDEPPVVAAPATTIAAKAEAPFAPVRVMHAEGKTKTLILRDAFAVQLVCTGKRASVAPGAALVLDRFLAFVPAGAIRWALLGANSTSVRGYRGTADATRAQTMLVAKRGAYFWLASDDDPAKPAKTEPDDPAFMVAMSIDDESPNQVIELRFPSSFVWERGADAIVAFVAEIVGLLPRCQSGHAGLELAMHPMITGTSHHARAAIPALAAKHPGYTFGDASTVTLDDEPVTRLRAISWLTILGPALATAHAKAAQRAGGVLRAAGKATIVRAGAAPSPDPDAKRMAKIAAALWPAMQLGETFQRQIFEDAEGEHDPRAFAAWEFRFLGGLAGANKHLDAQRDDASRIRRAELAIALGDTARAEELVAALAKAKADREEVNHLRYQLAQRAEAAGDTATAIRWYDAMIAAGPNNEHIERVRGLLATPPRRSSARRSAGRS